MNLSGKAAVVTGAATGVGRAVAVALARGGCRVAVNYRESQADAEETARLVREAGSQALVVQADVAEDAACRRLIAAAAESFGRLDVLVNNAGTTRFIAAERLEDVTDGDWDRVFGVNVKGAFQCARAAAPVMRSGGGGAIVNVSSIAAFLGAGSSIPYCASKGALNTLTLALARALAPDIRVNGVAPGFIAGRWLERGLGTGYESAKRAFEERLPLGRVCQPEDIADAVLGLLAADLVTGQTLICDGGMAIAKWSASLGSSPRRDK